LQKNGPANRAFQEKDGERRRCHVAQSPSPLRWRVPLVNERKLQALQQAVTTNSKPRPGAVDSTAPGTTPVPVQGATTLAGEPLVYSAIKKLDVVTG